MRLSLQLAGSLFVMGFDGFKGDDNITNFIPIILKGCAKIGNDLTRQFFGDVNNFIKYFTQNREADQGIDEDACEKRFYKLIMQKTVLDAEIDAARNRQYCKKPKYYIQPQ